MNPKISIIIPVYNKIDLTIKCLKAIEANSPLSDIEVIVVDNASSDNTSKELESWDNKLPIKILHNETNLGYGKANNQAASIARGEYLLLLNNDTEPQQNWIEPMAYTFSQFSKVGAVGCKLIYSDGLIQHAGVATVNDEIRKCPISLFHIGHKCHDGPKFSKLMRVQAVTAACMMIPKKIFQEINGFDEKYWNGFEDVDLCFKILEAGYEIFYQPNSVVIHHESQSGFQRHVREGENASLLNSKWKDIITCIFVIREPHKIELNDAATVVIVTQNSEKTIEHCLNALDGTLRSHDEVIIIDNNSTDNTCERVKSFIKVKKQYRLLNNHNGLSYSNAAKQAAYSGVNPYIAFVKPYAIVTKNWMENLFIHLLPQKIGAVGPLTNFDKGVQSIAQHIPDNISEIAYDNVLITKLNDLYKRQSIYVHSIDNFCFAVKRKIFERTNRVENDSKTKNNEDDIIYNLKASGYRLAIAKDTIILQADQSFRDNLKIHPFNSVNQNQHSIEPGKYFPATKPISSRESKIKPVCICGMHRSGTSMIVRLLNICGLHLGPTEKMIPPHPDNPRGYWEHIDFMNINNRILASFGGGWDYLPQFPPNWTSNDKIKQIKQEAIHLTDSFEGYSNWGWKDPRNSLTVAFWKKIMPNLKVIICIRNPLEVALSLRKRNGSSIFFGLNLWQSYYRSLLCTVKIGERMVTNYETYFRRPKDELSRVLDWIGMDTRNDRIDAAISSINTQLHRNRHYMSPSMDNRPQIGLIMKLYDTLCHESRISGHR